ncbi:MAG TPA: DUF6600 domain-containing protein [Hyphomicrobiaceae bacterium]|nr:DUF6600 domain-containing protein [Hyphomicrobiaceae bacterium]
MAMIPKVSRPRVRLLLAALFALLTLAAQPATAQDRAVDIDLFYEQLEPYGQWFEHPVWGTVWRPRVDADWRPYAHGMWVYTDDFGWYWEAEEPWGWAPFHYGRWLIDENGAWIWIPDTEWGPAWVAWRGSDDYVGWAPLPPDAHWGAGGDLLFDTGFYSAPRYHSVWCFVRPHQLILPGLHRYLVPRRQANQVFRSSHPFRAHRKFEGRFVNAGFDVKRFERMTGRPVVRMRIKAVDSPQASSLPRARAQGAEISVYKPRFVDRPEGGARIHRPTAVDPNAGNAAGRSLGRDSPDRGAASDRTRVPTPERNPAPGLGSPGAQPAPGPAATVGPSPPSVRAPANEASRERRPQTAPGDWNNRNRQRPPSGVGEAERGRGPPPGLNQRAYGGTPAGTPRAYSAPSPTLRPTAPSMGAPAGVRAPQPSQLPAVRPPANDQPRRGPPSRKDDNRGPG